MMSSFEQLARLRLVMGEPSACFMAALVVMVLVLVSSTIVPAVTAFDGYNGLPRPSGMDGEPTTTLGRKPAVDYDGKRADCAWYAWENFHYPPEETSNCSKLLWSALSQGADASTLQGFTYYAPADQPEFYDPAFQEYFCLVGCFNLAASNGSFSPAPPPENAPPPASRSPPPAAPPPSLAPRVAPPPPATLFRPPPPASLPQAPPAGAVLSPPSGGPQAPRPVPIQTSGGVCSFPSLLLFMAGLFLSIGALGSI